MSVRGEPGEMASERIARGMLPRVLNSFDMTIIFVAIVLFVVNAAALQPARQSAFTFWIHSVQGSWRPSGTHEADVLAAQRRNEVSFDAAEECV
jgi:hypothetical protein